MVTYRCDTVSGSPRPTVRKVRKTPRHFRVIEHFGVIEHFCASSDPKPAARSDILQSGLSLQQIRVLSRQAQVGTWNVAYGRGTVRNARRRAEFAQSRKAADVWVLTETHDHLVPDDCRNVASTTQRPGVGTIAGVVDGSRWVSIRSSHLMTKLSVADPERTVAALISRNTSQLVVFGTVLPWYNDVERAGTAAELAIQGKHWISFAQQHPHRVCVAGDFNVRIGGPHYYWRADSRRRIEERLSQPQTCVL